MEISVIMLTYNREKYISKAIVSILNQTFQEFEFIIVDNGSTDNSGNIAEKYANRDKRIKLVHIEKSSIGKGRNVGIGCASGRYITYIDDDDYAEKDMLEFLYDIIKKEDADIALCGSNKMVEGEILPNCVFDEYMVMGAEEAVTELLKRKKYNAAMPTKLLKRELFERIPFREDGKYDDITVVYKYFTKALKTVANGVPKYCFVRHESNNSGFTSDDSKLEPEQLEEYFNVFGERTKYLMRELPGIADYARYSEWSYLISMCNKIEKNSLRKCEKQLNYIKGELKEHYMEFRFGKHIQQFEKIWMDKYIEMSDD